MALILSQTQSFLVAQHRSVVILEKCKFFRKKGKYFGALMINLSESFDRLCQKLLIEKNHAFGFYQSALD